MKALDCCAGAGGLSLGLHRAGFDVLGVELDQDACEAHRRSVGPCDHASLWDYSPRETYELVAGGIPCQSHSMAGRRGGTCDPRGQLYVPFLRIANEANARAVLIENVRGMLTSPSATHGTSLLEVVSAIKEAGFEHTTARVLDAADYGVPQHRHRLFILGFRDAADLARFEWPRPTHDERGEGLFGLRRWVSVRQALGLPKQDGSGVLDKPAPTIKTRFDEGEDKARPSRRPTAELRKALSAAGHHTSNKAGAVAQLAALQSFPPGFEFVGTKKAQHRQVGNAVPLPLAEAVGRAVFAAVGGASVAAAARKAEAAE